MVRLHNIVLLLIEPVGHDNLVRVLLRVDGVLLQADVHLAEVHGRRIRPQLLPEMQLVGVLHRPDLLSLEVCEPVYRLVRGHDAEPLIRVPQQLKSGFSVGFLHLLQELRLVHGLSHRLNIAEDARRVKHRCIVNEADLRGRVLDHERDVPVIAALQKLPVPAQHTVRIDCDLDPSFA